MLHSHRATTLQFWVQSQIFGRHEQTRMWSSLPMFWTAGLNTAMGSTLAAGGCWVMQETFEPGEALALMARERVTEPYTLPHQTGALEEHPDWATHRPLVAHLRLRQVGLRPAPVGARRHDLADAGRLRPLRDLRLLLRPLVERRRVTRWPQSMGRLLPGNELRVVDPGHRPGRSASGETGELAVKGPTLDEGLPRDGARQTASTPTGSSTPATPARSTPTASCTGRAVAPR